MSIMFLHQEITGCRKRLIHKKSGIGVVVLPKNMDIIHTIDGMKVKSPVFSHRYYLMKYLMAIVKALVVLMGLVVLPIMVYP